MFEILKDGLRVIAGPILGCVFMLALVGIFLIPFFVMRLAIGGF